MTPPRDLLTWPVLAGDKRARGYDSGAGGDGGAAGVVHNAASRQGPLAGLAAALDAVGEVTVQALTEPALRVELAALQTAARRIEARLACATATLAARRVAAVRESGGDDRAVDRARRATRNEVAGALKLTPGQVRDAERVGDRLTATPDAAEAFTAGDISARHMQILDRTLASLSGDIRRDAEAELLDAARSQSTVEFNDTCTRLLARLDLAAASRAEALRHARRTGTVVRGDDGMTGIHARLAGIQAEIAATAIHAYRRHDIDGERRTSEQRTADALVAAFQAALDHKTAIDNGAPVRHGIRPHVIVTVDLDSLVRADAAAGVSAAGGSGVARGSGGAGGSRGAGVAGVAEGEWTGPLIWDRVRTILDDAGMSFITIGDDLPVAVTKETRNVPVGLFKALALRDGGCIHQSCDMPAWWCQVMHLDTPYRHGGRLRADSGALGCHHHHTMFDAGRLDLAWVNGKPVLRPPPRE